MPTRQTLTAARVARRAQRRAAGDLADAQVLAGQRPGIPRWWPMVATLALIGAVIAATTGVLAWSRTAHAYTDADFRAAAVTTVADLLSPNADAPDQVRAILDGATSPFYDDFAQSAQAYTAFVRRNATVASATIDGVGVSARDGDTATVLVAATVGYAQRTPPVADQRYRLRVVVTADASRLKTAEVQYLS